MFKEKIVNFFDGGDKRAAADAGLGSLRTWLVVRFVGKNASAAVATDVWLYGLEGHNGLKGRPQTRPGDWYRETTLHNLRQDIHADGEEAVADATEQLDTTGWSHS